MRKFSKPLILCLFLCATGYAGNVQLLPPDQPSGYIARLLLNETPFPSENGWISEKNSKAAMLSILCVVDARVRHIPVGYKQEQVAAIRTDNAIDVITAGGEKGQCDGFYKDTQGQPVMVPRIGERIAYLEKLANKGTPGRFARLFSYAQGIASAYVRGGLQEADRFAAIHQIGSIYVTGRAYSWMTGQDYYHPGGNFVKIPNDMQGLLGGNRFFTLKKLEK
ncbi:MAG: hypothetical protein EOL87_16685 [Spartobacteria bacterium]|nr:hypothetical protein [Spartobacteria bacterium]